MCGACAITCQKQGAAVYSKASKALNQLPMLTPHRDVMSEDGPQPKIVDGVITLTDFADTNCMNCGQCILTCPTDAITTAGSTRFVRKAMKDKKKVAALIAPTTHVAMPEHFNGELGIDSTSKTVGALRKAGFTTIHDVNYGADLTTLEDMKELKHALKHGNTPVFTSCCPAWVLHAEKNVHWAIPHISTAKSCVSMVASILREDPEYKDAFIVDIMPCTAKKYERAREELCGEIDACLTIYEAAELIKEAGVRSWDDVEESDFDQLGGNSSGGAAIFGIAGGVMTNIIRQLRKEEGYPDEGNIELTEVYRKLNQNAYETSFTYKGKTVKACYANGGSAVRFVLKELEKDKSRWDVVECMMCPGGCRGGAGVQKKAKTNKPALLKAREQGMKARDEKLGRTAPEDIAEVNDAYKTYMIDEKDVERILHTSFKIIDIK